MPTLHSREIKNLNVCLPNWKCWLVFKSLQFNGGCSFDAYGVVGDESSIAAIVTCCTIVTHTYSYQ